MVTDGLTLVPFDAAELDACELGVEGETPAGVDVGLVVWGLVVLIVLVGVGDGRIQGVPVVLAAFAPRGALKLEVADAFVPALLVTALLAGVLVTLPVVGGVLVTLALSLGFVLSLAGLLLVPPLVRLDTGGAGGTFGVTDLPAVAGATVEAHTVAVPPAWAMAVLPWPMPRCDEPSRVPPGRGWLGGVLVLGEVIPTC